MDLWVMISFKKGGAGGIFIFWGQPNLDHEVSEEKLGNEDQKAER
jgi:hypothetical protein